MSAIKEILVSPNINGACILKITDDEGTYGLGAVYGYDLLKYDTAETSSLLKGRNVRDYSSSLDMVKELVRTKAVSSQAEFISAVDTALFDLLSRSMGLPALQLLGGSVRDSVRIAHDHAIKRHVPAPLIKVPFTGEPYFSREGLKDNLHILEEAKEDSPSSGIIFTCDMGLDQEYMVRLIKGLRETGVRYIRLPLSLMSYDLLRRMKDLLNQEGIMLMLTETGYTLLRAREVISGRCCDILRLSIPQCGGLSEVRKIASYSQINGVMIVPVGSDRSSMSFALSNLNTPFIESYDSAESICFGSASGSAKEYEPCGGSAMKRISQV